MGEDEVGVEVGPGFDCSLIAADMGEKGSDIRFYREGTGLQEVEGVGCAEKVGLFCHFYDGGAG